MVPYSFFPDLLIYPFILSIRFRMFLTPLPIHDLYFSSILNCSYISVHHEIVCIGIFSNRLWGLPCWGHVTMNYTQVGTNCTVSLYYHMYYKWKKKEFDGLTFKTFIFIQNSFTFSSNLIFETYQSFTYRNCSFLNNTKMKMRTVEAQELSLRSIMPLGQALNPQLLSYAWTELGLTLNLL